MTDERPKYDPSDAEWRHWAWRALSAPFPEDSVERTKAEITRKGYDTTGIKYVYVAQRMNEVLGIGGWKMHCSYEVSESKTRAGRRIFDVTCDCGIVLIDRASALVWGEVSACGGHSSFTLSDAKKGAQTNAFKKAAAWLGCAWEAYAGILDDDHKPVPAVEDIMEKAMLSDQEVKAKIQEYAAELGKELCSSVTRGMDRSTERGKRAILSRLQLEMDKKKGPAKAGPSDHPIAHSLARTKPLERKAEGKSKRTLMEDKLWAAADMVHTDRTVSLAEIQKRYGVKSTLDMDPADLNDATEWYAERARGGAA